MENIITNTQIPTDSLRKLTRLILLAILSGFTTALFGQAPNKRAVKLTTKAEEQASFRDFDGAKELLKKAIEVDPLYSKPYLRLAAIFNIYQETDSACAYYNKLAKAVPEHKIDQKLWARIAGINYEVGNYQLAKQALNKVGQPDSFLLRSIDFSLESISKAIELEIVQLSENINAYELQYFPALTIDENTIIYTKRNANHPSADEDIMVSKKIKGNWIPAQSLSFNINTQFNEGACTISADGSVLIFTACEGRQLIGSCDLFITRRTGNRWSKPENLGDKINSVFWDSQPTLSADGRTLYFSSNRPGGFGKRDLWKSKFSQDGWTTPVNLGPSINTKWDEITPFIHSSNSTLFFSSQGHPGLGGYDLFYSIKENEEWLAPQNLGYPINTKDEEISMFINANGSKAYFAKESILDDLEKKSVIVEMTFPYDSILKSRSSYLVGRVLDNYTKEPIGSSFRMYNLNDSTDQYFVSSDSISGKFFLVLNEGAEYGVFIKKDGYLFEDFRVEPKTSSILKPDTLDIFLKPIAIGETVILENIFFEHNSSELDLKSQSELRELTDYLLLNNGFDFIIEGHTDDTGSEAYNVTLSEARARAVYQYLVDQKVDSKRITIIGLGSSMPIESNISEAGRRKNRRITFRITSKG